VSTTLETLIASGQVTDPASAKGRLLHEATHLFITKGYERSTVRDIAKAVGIQSGSIFHHFKTKEDILRAVMEEIIFLITAHMLEDVAKADTVQDKVFALIRCELAFVIGETSEAMSVLVYEWRSLSPDNQRDILKLRNIYEQIWLDVLREAKEAGLLSMDIFVLRRLLTGALGWTHNWYSADGSMSLDLLAEQAMQLVFK